MSILRDLTIELGGISRSVSWLFDKCYCWVHLAREASGSCRIFGLCGLASHNQTRLVYLRSKFERSVRDAINDEIYVKSCSWLFQNSDDFKR